MGAKRSIEEDKHQQIRRLRDGMFWSQVTQEVVVLERCSHSRPGSHAAIAELPRATHNQNREISGGLPAYGRTTAGKQQGPPFRSSSLRTACWKAARRQAPH